MADISGVYDDALKSVKSWLINPIKSTVDFILDNALKLAAGILALPIFLLMYPFKKIATSGIFNGPAPRPTPFAERMNTRFGSIPSHIADRRGVGVGKLSLVNTYRGLKDNAATNSTTTVGEMDLDYTENIDTYVDPAKRINTELISEQAAIEMSLAEYKKINQEMCLDENKVHIAIIGRTGAGKSSLVNAFRGLRDKAPDAAPVGEKDCTKSLNRYVDPRFPWIVWFDVPGAGTQERPSTRYFEDQGLFLMDFVLVVCSNRVIDLDMDIIQRARHYGIPAALVRSKADQDLRERAKRECDDDDDEDEIKSKVKRVKPGYVKEIKEDLMNEVEQAGLQGYVTRENCFLVSARIVRELMRSTKDLPELQALDENSYRYKLAEIKAAVTKHIKRIFSKADEIDEKDMLEMVFTSVAESRYF